MANDQQLRSEAVVSEPTVGEIEEAADLARDFGLVGLASEGHKKLARLAAEIRREKSKPGRPPGAAEKVRQKPEIERVKPLPSLPEIVKGTGWRLR